MPLSRPQAIEAFHLAFIAVLVTRLDRALFVLKGGANLRYFFDSHRYSEDIDFDVEQIERWKLEELVDGVIDSPALRVLLRGPGIAITRATKPKQTDTTQRWKLQIMAADWREPAPTKIEFGRRNGETRLKDDPVPARIVNPYGLRPPSLQHYEAAPATEQKVLALADRSEVQARDAFDLELLFRTHPGVVEAGAIDNATLKRAIDRCLELPFEAFQDQVVAFLEPDVAEVYDNREAWEQIQTFVAERLTELLT